MREKNIKFLKELPGLIHRFLYYAGETSEDYELVKHKVLTSNRRTVILISGCATALITLMFIFTFFVPGVEANRMVYTAGSVLSFIILTLALTYAKDHLWITIFLVQGSYLIFYAYGILIGAVTDAGQKTVTFIAMLVFLPVLFAGRPIASILTTCAYVAVFITLCLQNKTGAVLQNDVIDALLFGALGLISGSAANRTKIHSYVLELDLQKSSRFDQLTQLNNRNFYELELDHIPDRASRTLACIYIDVNGLHELNNEEGHASGDRMLKYVAHQIKTFFGEELTFRIGGDEFVAFAPDMDKIIMEQNLLEMVYNIEKAGYHVALGTELMQIQYLSIQALIKSAETKMYQNKKRFYKDRNHDRRRA